MAKPTRRSRRGEAEGVTGDERVREGSPSRWGSGGLPPETFGALSCNIGTVQLYFKDRIVFLIEEKFKFHKLMNRLERIHGNPCTRYDIHNPNRH